MLALVENRMPIQLSIPICPTPDIFLTTNHNSVHVCVCVCVLDRGQRGTPYTPLHIPGKPIFSEALEGPKHGIKC